MREFFANPHNFDCPPPNYERSEEAGWTMLAKAIIANDGGLDKYVGYAQRFKAKLQEWENLPFIKSQVINNKKTKKYTNTIDFLSPFSFKMFCFSH